MSLSVSEFVPGVRRAVVRALEPNEFRNSVFQIFRKGMVLYMVTPPEGSGQHPKNQTHSISTEKREIFLKTIISLTLIQVRFLLQKLNLKTKLVCCRLRKNLWDFERSGFQKGGEGPWTWTIFQNRREGGTQGSRDEMWFFTYFPK